MYTSHHLLHPSSQQHHPVQSQPPKTTWGDRAVSHIWWQRWDVTLTETLGGRRKDSTTSPAGDGLPAAQLELQQELERQQELEPEAWWPTCLATVLRDSRRGRKCEKVKFSSPSHRLMRSLALVWTPPPQWFDPGSPTIVAGPGRPNWLK